MPTPEYELLEGIVSALNSDSQTKRKAAAAQIVNSLTEKHLQALDAEVISPRSPLHYGGADVHTSWYCWPGMAKAIIDCCNKDLRNLKKAEVVFAKALEVVITQGCKPARPSQCLSRVARSLFGHLAGTLELFGPGGKAPVSKAAGGKTPAHEEIVNRSWHCLEALLAVPAYAVVCKGSDYFAFVTTFIEAAKESCEKLRHPGLLSTYMERLKKILKHVPVTLIPHQLDRVHTVLCDLVPDFAGKHSDSGTASHLADVLVYYVLQHGCDLISGMPVLYSKASGFMHQLWKATLDRAGGSGTRTQRQSCLLFFLLMLRLGAVRTEEQMAKVEESAHADAGVPSECFKAPSLCLFQAASVSQPGNAFTLCDSLRARLLATIFVRKLEMHDGAQKANDAQESQVSLTQTLDAEGPARVRRRTESPAEAMLGNLERWPVTTSASLAYLMWQLPHRVGLHVTLELADGLCSAAESQLKTLTSQSLTAEGQTLEVAADVLAWICLALEGIAVTAWGVPLHERSAQAACADERSPRAHVLAAALDTDRMLRVAQRVIDVALATTSTPVASAAQGSASVALWSELLPRCLHLVRALIEHHLCPRSTLQGSDRWDFIQRLACEGQEALQSRSEDTAAETPLPKVSTVAPSQRRLSCVRLDNTYHASQPAVAAHKLASLMAAYTPALDILQLAALQLHCERLQKLATLQACPANLPLELVRHITQARIPSLLRSTLLLRGLGLPVPGAISTDAPLPRPGTPRACSIPPDRAPYVLTQTQSNEPLVSDGLPDDACALLQHEKQYLCGSWVWNCQESRDASCRGLEEMADHLVPFGPAPKDLVQQEAWWLQLFASARLAHVLEVSIVCSRQHEALAALEQTLLGEVRAAASGSRASQSSASGSHASMCRLLDAVAISMCVMLSLKEASGMDPQMQGLDIGKRFDTSGQLFMALRDGLRTLCVVDTAAPEAQAAPLVSALTALADCDTERILPAPEILALPGSTQALTQRSVMTQRLTQAGATQRASSAVPARSTHRSVRTAPSEGPAAAAPLAPLFSKSPLELDMMPRGDNGADTEPAAAFLSAAALQSVQLISVASRALGSEALSEVASAMEHLASAAANQIADLFNWHADWTEDVLDVKVQDEWALEDVTMLNSATPATPARASRSERGAQKNAALSRTLQVLVAVAFANPSAAAKALVDVVDTLISNTDAATAQDMNRVPVPPCEWLLAVLQAAASLVELGADIPADIPLDLLEDRSWGIQFWIGAKLQACHALLRAAPTFHDQQLFSGTSPGSASGERAYSMATDALAVLVRCYRAGRAVTGEHENDMETLLWASTWQLRCDLLDAVGGAMKRFCVDLENAEEAMLPEFLLCCLRDPSLRVRYRACRWLPTLLRSRPELSGVKAISTLVPMQVVASNDLEGGAAELGSTLIADLLVMVLPSQTLWRELRATALVAYGALATQSSRSSHASHGIGLLLSFATAAQEEPLTGTASISAGEPPPSETIDARQAIVQTVYALLDSLTSSFGYADWGAFLAAHARAVAHGWAAAGGSPEGLAALPLHFSAMTEATCFELASAAGASSSGLVHNDNAPAALADARCMVEARLFGGEGTDGAVGDAPDVQSQLHPVRAATHKVLEQRPRSKPSLEGGPLQCAAQASAGPSSDLRAADASHDSQRGAGNLAALLSVLVPALDSACAADREASALDLPNRFAALATLVRSTDEKLRKQYWVQVLAARVARRRLRSPSADLWASGFKGAQSDSRRNPFQVAAQMVLLAEGATSEGNRADAATSLVPSAASRLPVSDVVAGCAAAFQSLEDSKPEDVSTENWLAHLHTQHLQLAILTELGVGALRGHRHLPDGLAALSALHQMQQAESDRLARFGAAAQSSKSLKADDRVIGSLHRVYVSIEVLTVKVRSTLKLLTVCCNGCGGVLTSSRDVTNLKAGLEYLLQLLRACSDKTYIPLCASVVNALAMLLHELAVRYADARARSDCKLLEAHQADSQHSRAVTANATMERAPVAEELHSLAAMLAATDQAVAHAKAQLHSLSDSVDAEEQASQALWTLLMLPKVPAMFGLVKKLPHMLSQLDMRGGAFENLESSQHVWLTAAELFASAAPALPHHLRAAVSARLIGPLSGAGNQPDAALPAYDALRAVAAGDGVIALLAPQAVMRLLSALAAADRSLRPSGSDVSDFVVAVLQGLSEPLPDAVPAEIVAPSCMPVSEAVSLALQPLMVTIEERWRQLDSDKSAPLSVIPDWLQVQRCAVLAQTAHMLADSGASACDQAPLLRLAVAALHEALRTSEGRKAAVQFQATVGRDVTGPQTAQTAAVSLLPLTHLLGSVTRHCLVKAGERSSSEGGQEGGAQMIETHGLTDMTSADAWALQLTHHLMAHRSVQRSVYLMAFRRLSACSVMIASSLLPLLLCTIATDYETRSQGTGKGGGASKGRGKGSRKRASDENSQEASDGEPGPALSAYAQQLGQQLSALLACSVLPSPAEAAAVLNANGHSFGTARHAAAVGCSGDDEACSGDQQHALLRVYSERRKIMQLVLQCLSALRSCYLSACCVSDKAKGKSEQERTGRVIAQVVRSWTREYWLDIDYLQVAAAAAVCGCPQEAALYAELWCASTTGRARLPDTAQLQSARAAPTPDSDGQHETEPAWPQPGLLMPVLWAAFDDLNDPDLIYGLATTPTERAVRAHAQREGAWPRALLLAAHQDLRRQVTSGLAVPSTAQPTCVAGMQRTELQSRTELLRSGYSTQPLCQELRVCLSHLGCLDRFEPQSSTLPAALRTSAPDTRSDPGSSGGVLTGSPLSHQIQHAAQHRALADDAEAVARALAIWVPPQVGSGTTVFDGVLERLRQGSVTAAHTAGASARDLAVRRLCDSSQIAEASRISSCAATLRSTAALDTTLSIVASRGVGIGNDPEHLYGALNLDAAKVQELQSVWTTLESAHARCGADPEQRQAALALQQSALNAVRAPFAPTTRAMAALAASLRKSGNLLAARRVMLDLRLLDELRCSAAAPAGSRGRPDATGGDIGGGDELWRIEEAKLFWAEGQQQWAINLLQEARTRLQAAHDRNAGDIDVSRHLAEAMCLQGKWQARAGSATGDEVLSTMQQATTLLGAGAPGQSDALSRLHYRLATFATSRYKFHASQLISRDFAHKQALLEDCKAHLEQAQAQLDQSRRSKRIYEPGKKDARGNPVWSAEYKRQCSLVTRARNMIDDLTREVQTVQRQAEQYLLAAVRAYHHALQQSGRYDMKAGLMLVHLWLANSTSSEVNNAMLPIVQAVPSYKLVRFADQIASRMGPAKELESYGATAATLLARLAMDHPHHVIRRLLLVAGSALMKSKPSKSRKSARTDSTSEVSEQSAGRAAAAARILEEVGSRSEWHRDLLRAMRDVFDFYQALAHVEKKEGRSQLTLDWTSLRLPISKVQRSEHVPVLTLEIPVRQDAVYENLPYVEKVDKRALILGGLSSPLRVTVTDNYGQTHEQIAKAADDLRSDEVMQQYFGLVNSLLAADKSAAMRRLRLITYVVVPIDHKSGLIEFCQNTVSLDKYLVNRLDESKGAHGRHSRPGQLRYNEAFTKMRALPQQGRDTDQFRKLALDVFTDVCDRYQPVMRRFFLEHFRSAALWLEKQTAYTRSVAVNSMVGYIVGLGDRHINNVLIDAATAEMLHIDFGIAFDAGRHLPLPEYVPFRLTRDIVDGLGLGSVHGPFKRCSEVVLRVLQESHEAVLSVVEVLLHDPLYVWVLTEDRAQKAQRSPTESPATQHTGKSSDGKSATPLVLSNPDAERVVSRVREKLLGRDNTEGAPMSIEVRVMQLTHQAMDPANLCRLFAGWSAWV